MLTSADKTQNLCIKAPELISSLSVVKIEVGPSMALAIERETNAAFVIGINQKGELGVGDTKIRK